MTDQESRDYRFVFGSMVWLVMLIAAALVLCLISHVSAYHCHSLQDELDFREECLAEGHSTKECEDMKDEAFNHDPPGAHANGHDGVSPCDTTPEAPLPKAPLPKAPLPKAPLPPVKPVELKGYFENPPNRSVQSGIGLISGWVCGAWKVEVYLEGRWWNVPRGSERQDTAGECRGRSNRNGYGLTYNWNRLDDGDYTVKLRVNGKHTWRAYITVVTFGEEFARHLEGGVWIEDFPDVGQRTYLGWEESSQSFKIKETE